MSGTFKKGDEPVPGYRLEHFLGQGAFGQVWKANAPGGTEAALKIISLSGKQGLKEFRALGLVKKIRHPNLVPIVAFWLKDQSGNLLDDALALEDLEKKASEVSKLVATMVVEMQQSPKPVELVIAMGLGEMDLARRLEECRGADMPGIPVAELLGYMEDAARAIDYLNRPRTSGGVDGVAVQHCDIKPFNIMIVGDAAQVCDFGLARMLGDVRKTATAAGTVAYVAPECLSNFEPSISTDQYSLAVTYVELRTGSLPYRSERLPEVVNAVLKGELDLSRLPEGEQTVIRRAVALDPFERWPSATEMVHALRRAVNSPEVPSKKSRGGALGMIAVVIVLLAAALALGGWYAWTKQDKSVVIETPIDEVRSDSVSDHTTPDDPHDEPSPKVEPKKTTEPSQPTVVVAPVENPKPPTDTPRMPDADAQLKRANELFEQGELDEALSAVNKIIDSAKTPNLDALLLRGTIYLEKTDYAKSIADFTTIIKVDGRNVRAISRRGQAHLRQRTFAMAVTDFTQVIALDPDARDYVGRAVAYSGMGDQVHAIADLSDAIRLDPTSAEAYSNRGVLYFERQEWPAALADFNSSIKIDDSDAFTLAQAAWLLATAPEASMRDGKRAVELATRACELSQWTKSDYIDDLGAALAESRDFDSAIERTKRAISLETDPQLKKEYQSRLTLYTARKPYHMSP